MTTRSHDHQRIRRGVLFLVAVMVMTAMVGVVPRAAAATGGLTIKRTCADFMSGDRLRQLSICARGWTDSSGLYSRGVVEMHTYRYSTSGWIDSPSQSITVNSAQMASSPGPLVFGNAEEAKCRVDSPAGRVGCSVAGATRVAFYSPLKRRYSQPGPCNCYDRLTVFVVSWRDDRGTPHVVRSGDASIPDRMPVTFEW